ncbi:MAG: RHS repeat-associated core domain-containing protein [Saprospiraceae bacterium]|nr:RHS repeat-associated core domain-containing protein [Saprospiraceae bacterium]
MSRNGFIGGPTCEWGMIDDLTYSYDAQRTHLTNVADAAPLPGRDKGFKPKPGAGAYLYDDNGNMTFDPHKDITITYNFLNLPSQIVKTGAGGGTMSLTYDAAGRKWRKQVAGVIKDYCQGIEYKDGKVEAVYGQEGRLTAVYDQYGVTLTSFRAEYWLKDHLGNTRIAFADENHNGTIEVWDDPSTPENEAEIIQENHYYPFGMNQEGPWYATIGPRNGYQYNGKELNEELELGWNDFGARWQDPATGRWWQVDPLAEKYVSISSYACVANNPVIHFDPDGMRTSLIDELRDKNYGGISAGGSIQELNKFKYDGDIQVIDPGNQKSANNVGNQLVSNIEKMDEEGTINCSQETACYPTVWLRLKQAYINLYGFAPSVFNNSGIYQYDISIGAERWYPEANTEFSILFGSNISSKKWTLLPKKYRGKGAPGAMTFAGLGEMINNIWDGSLLPGAVLQFWKSNADFLRVAQGDSPKSIGHSAIFIRYQRTFWGSISGIVYADQNGIHSMWNWYFRKYPVAFGANLKDLK